MPLIKKSFNKIREMPVQKSADFVGPARKKRKRKMPRGGLVRSKKEQKRIIEKFKERKKAGFIKYALKRIEGALYKPIEQKHRKP